MPEAKSFLASKTFRGLALVLLGLCAPWIRTQFGIEYDPAELSGWLIANAGEMLTGVGVLMAAIGRVKASAPVTFLPKDVTPPTPGRTALCLALAALLLTLPACGLKSPAESPSAPVQSGKLSAWADWAGKSADALSGVLNIAALCCPSCAPVLAGAGAAVQVVGELASHYQAEAAALAPLSGVPGVPTVTEVELAKADSLAKARLAAAIRAVAAATPEALDAAGIRLETLGL